MINSLNVRPFGKLKSLSFIINLLLSHSCPHVCIIYILEQRENQPPVAVVTPERQTIKLPVSEAVLDAASSKDDEGVVSYHWELTQGPLGYAPTLIDSPTLQLHNLSQPGNYSYR